MVSKKFGFKAQMNQAFVYIAAILVISLLIFVAVKSWGSIFKANCEVQRVEFEKTLFSYIDKYSDYGTVKEVSIVVPCEVDEVCFSDSSFMTADIGGDVDEVMRSNINSQTANVFIKSDFTEALKFSSKIAIDPSDSDRIICLKAKNSKIKIRFLGQGKTVFVEDAS
jgi:hypothetical protein